MTYKKRILDEQLKFMLSASGAVLIEGPKWCGKTTTAKQIAKSFIAMDDPKHLERNILLSKMEPDLLLSGETPRLIDEWQISPVLWDTVRHEVDRRSKMGQFILTGSSIPADKSKIIHSGTGRIARLKMRTMSLYESNESDGTFSLSKLFNNETIKASLNDLSLSKLSFLICRGGWPMSIDLENKVALQQAKNYVNSVVESDMNSDGIVKKSQLVRSFMKSYSRNIASKASIATIQNDIINIDDSLSRPTIYSYLNSLKAIHLIDELEAWNPNLRSSSAIRTTPTRMFVDPSIAVASLGISPDDLIKDYKTFGLLFEALCIRDLRVYTDLLGGHVFHYRDSNNLECDAIIHLPNGKWAAIEIKLGDHQQEDAAKNLKKLVEVIDTNKMNHPSFLMVLTGGNASYQREDGIFVVSIASLKP